MSTFSLPPLANWQDFERLCCDLWQRIWGVPHANLHGRLGQPQHGVDVYAPLENGQRWAGVQCKETKSRFPSKATIEAEVEKARKFMPPLSSFVLATTASNDGRAQEWAREITEAQLEDGSFSVTIYGWEDICRELTKHPDLVRHHFPDFSWAPEKAAEAAASRSEDPLEALRLTYLADLYSDLEPVQMTVFGGGSHRSKTRLQEVYIGLDVSSGFQLPGLSRVDRKAGAARGGAELEMMGELGEPRLCGQSMRDRCAAEAQALVRAKKIPPQKERPYGRRFTALEAAGIGRKLVLTGPAGSGKSTFGRYLTLCLAGEGLGRSGVDLDALNRDRAASAGAELPPGLRAWPHGAPLPFFVELRRFVAGDAFPSPGESGAARHLFEHLAGLWGGDGFRQLLSRALEKENGVLVILDGLDETPAAESSRTRLKQVIEGFVRAWPACRLIVTSRPYAYDDERWQLEGFCAESLAPFDSEKRQSFVRGWYEHLAARGQVDRDQVERRSTSLLRQLERLRYLVDLAERPLMLTMITDLHASEGGRLPGGRAGLYERSVGLLLDRWNQVRHEVDIAERLGMDAGRLRRALERLAYEVQKDRGEVGKAEAAQLTDVELWEALRRERPEDCKIDDQEVRDYLHQRSGILLGESPATYRFPHRSYQEFLAACYLRKTSFPKFLVQEVREDPALWREVFLFVVGQAAETPYAAWGVLEALVPKAVREKVTAEDPGFEHALCAGLALEETGLWREVEEQDEGKLDRIRSWLQRALEVGALSPLDRAAAGRILGRFGPSGDQRPGLGLDTGGIPAIEWVEIPAGSFLMGEEKRKVRLRHGFRIARYPVTNLQYRAFVDAGGYTERWRHCWTEEGWDWRTKENRLGSDDDLEEVFLLPNFPRVNVSWYEAWAFSQWLGENLGQPIFLPTEHQWERAGRGNDGRKYPWGEEAEPSRMNCVETGIDAPCAVGIFPTGASPEGVLDLSGNVWEWTASVWKDKPQDELAERPPDPAASPGGWRVFRGGSYGYPASWARAAYRNYGHPWLRFRLLGFRLVCFATRPEP